MPILYFLVGIPGSGKSTWGENFAKTICNTVYISSDQLRVEMYNNVNDIEHTGLVFEEMKKRTKENLKNGKNVVYDATNISSKKRISFLKELEKIDCKKVCFYLFTPIEECKRRNRNRERVLEDYIIDRMYRSLQIPMYHEGWDAIRILSGIDFKNKKEFKFNIDEIRTYDDYINNVLDKPSTRQCIDFAQDNPYHSFSVSRHMWYVTDYLINHTNNRKLILAGMLHDIGKPYCKVFKPGNRYASFIYHDNISAQLAVDYLIRAGLDTNSVIEAATYIQLHMRIMNYKDNIEGKEKFKNLIGKIMYDNLELLHNADIQAK